MLGACAERAPRERGRERDGDGLRASQRADELLFKYRDMVCVGVLIHGFLLWGRLQWGSYDLRQRRS